MPDSPEAQPSPGLPESAGLRERLLPSTIMRVAVEKALEIRPLAKA